MSITYPITMPTSRTPQKVTISALNVASANQSPFTGSTQVQEFPGEWIQLQVSLPPIKDRVTAQQWVSALISLRGIVGTFEYGDPTYKGPFGVAIGTPVTDGAQAAGSKTLTISGFTHSVTGILKNGDYIQAAGASGIKYLYRVLADANSNSSGVATFDIFPRLREAIADDVAVVFSSPKGTWRLTSNQRDFSVDEALVYGISFTAKEAF